MALTKIDYDVRARSAGLNLYFVAEGDREYNVRTQCVVPANPCCNCYSIAKAFTVTAIGMLYDRGLLTPDTRLADVLGDKFPQNIDAKWNNVTLHHLMTHHVGFGEGLLDIDAEDASKYPTKDYLSIILSTPLPHAPGEMHQYTDAAYYLLSRVVERLAGMDIADLLRPVLMGTMDFKEFAWSVCPMGYSMGATGLYLRTEDVVKLGILYLNEGEWRGTRIVSKEWVDIVLKNHYEFRDRGNGWYGKSGMRGQMLTFNPARGLAVAWHGYERRVRFEDMIK